MGPAIDSLAVRRRPTLPVNPYRLVAASDHWGKNAQRVNPAVHELQTGRVIQAAWKGTPKFEAMVPAGYRSGTDVLLFTKEWIDGRNYMQMREFVAAASHEFLLVAAGHATVRLEYSGFNCNNSSERAYGFKVNPLDVDKLVKGVTYQLVPRNGHAKRPWIVDEVVPIEIP